MMPFVFSTTTGGASAEMRANIDPFNEMSVHMEWQIVGKSLLYGSCHVSRHQLSTGCNFVRAIFCREEKIHQEFSRGTGCQWTPVSTR